MITWLRWMDREKGQLVPSNVPSPTIRWMISWTLGLSVVLGMCVSSQRSARANSNVNHTTWVNTLILQQSEKVRTQIWRKTIEAGGRVCGCVCVGDVKKDWPKFKTSCPIGFRATNSMTASRSLSDCIALRNLRKWVLESGVRREKSSRWRSLSNWSNLRSWTILSSRPSSKMERNLSWSLK